MGRARLFATLERLRTRTVFIAFLVALAASMLGMLRQIDRAEQEMALLRERFLREHSLSAYNSQRDFLAARVALLEASPSDPYSWIQRYEIAAGRVETLNAFARLADATPLEREMVERYAAFIDAADAAIAAAPDPLTAAARVSALAEEAQPLFRVMVDEGLRRTRALRLEMLARNTAAIRDARLTTLAAFAALLTLGAALLALNHLLQVRAARLQKVGRELERALEVRRRFLAAVSHDFRTPLNAISGFAQILLHEEIPTTPEKRRRFLGQILEASRRLERMTRDLLDLARMERGAYALREEDGVDLSALARRVLTRLGPTATAAGVVLDGPAASERGPVLRADPGAVERALSNLVDNAVKFSPRGETVRLMVETAPGRGVITVEDRGPGIPPERMAEIWDLFGRGGAGPGGEKQGSGLGLAIARGLIEAHGGALSVDGRPGLGARFALSLPLRRADPRPAQG